MVLYWDFLINHVDHVSDQKFCIQAIKEHIELFGEAPKAFGFDRGYSKINIKGAKSLGVKDVGIAPTGKAAWEVSEKMAERIRSERPQVEGSIGTAKSKKYGFNKPDAKSTPAMKTYGHRSFLGMSLMKMVRELTTLEVQNA